MRTVFSAKAPTRKTPLHDLFFPSSHIANMPADSPTPKPHPKQTIETILKAMEKKPDNFELDGETRLADIGFAKDDFENFTTYCSHTYAFILS